MLVRLAARRLDSPAPRVVAVRPGARVGLGAAAAEQRIGQFPFRTFLRCTAQVFGLIRLPPDPRSFRCVTANERIHHFHFVMLGEWRKTHFPSAATTGITDPRRRPTPLPPRAGLPQ